MLVLTDVPCTEEYYSIIHPLGHRTSLVYSLTIIDHIDCCHGELEDTPAKHVCPQFSSGTVKQKA